MNYSSSTSELFGEPQDSFTLIHAGVDDAKPGKRNADFPNNGGVRPVPRYILTG